MAELHDWLNAQLARISRNHDLAKAINYMLRRWDAFTRFLDDGRVCLSNNAAERSLRCVPLGRKSWLFCGSDRGGQRAAVAYSLIQTCRLNDVDPQAWLADVPRPHRRPSHQSDRRLAPVELAGRSDRSRRLTQLRRGTRRMLTQAEYRWIELYGHGLRANMPWWAPFDLRVWPRLDQWIDWIGPVVATCAVAWRVGRRR